MSTPSVINMTGLSIPSHEISHPQHTTTHTQPTSPTGSNDEQLSPIINCMLAGGFGGAIGDSVMHSLDTVKTRQQGSPNTIKYRNMISAYSTIFREEGLRRGLYGGYGAAMLGSFPSTAIFFGTYEGTKRLMIDTWGINETLTHLTAGFLGDFASSVVYVPSEVLKTRLQLQGQFNNPHFNSGYNYRGLTDAIKTLIAKEGAGTLFFGYKATLCRDLPFSALQFAFYEKFRDWAFFYNNLDSKKGDDLSITFELLTGAAAGGLAGSITTPLDVIKTRIQTQNPSSEPVTPSATHVKGQPVILQTGSVLKGLSIVYRTEGVSGLFSGVGPRFVWTSIQSSIMLLLYQVALRNLNDLLGNGKDQF